MTRYHASYSRIYPIEHRARSSSVVFRSSDVDRLGCFGNPPNVPSRPGLDL